MGSNGYHYSITTSPLPVNHVWFKTSGCSGEEVPNTIREKFDGELFICVTNSLGDYASVFLIMSDKIGELQN